LVAGFWQTRLSVRRLLAPKIVVTPASGQGNLA
jgi:hypothetical protein